MPVVRPFYRSITGRPLHMAGTLSRPQQSVSAMNTVFSRGSVKAPILSVSRDCFPGQGSDSKALHVPRRIRPAHPWDRKNSRCKFERHKESLGPSILANSFARETSCNRRMLDMRPPMLSRQKPALPSGFCACFFHHCVLSDPNRGCCVRALGYALVSPLPPGRPRGSVPDPGLSPLQE